MILALVLLFFLSCSTAALSLCPGGIPLTEIDSFLTVHNTLRQSIASGQFVAKDKRMLHSRDRIPNLTWNCELEERAQTHAKRCQYVHSPDLDNLGENVYMRWCSTKITISGLGNDSSKFWANEFQDYGWSDIKFTRRVFKSGIGDATQMAWQKTTKIGRGIAICNEERSAFVVCQYNDAGNYEDEFVYLPN